MFSSFNSNGYNKNHKKRWRILPHNHPRPKTPIGSSPSSPCLSLCLSCLLRVEITRGGKKQKTSLGGSSTCSHSYKYTHQSRRFHPFLYIFKLLGPWGAVAKKKKTFLGGSSTRSHSYIKKKKNIFWGLGEPWLPLSTRGLSLLLLLYAHVKKKKIMINFSIFIQYMYIYKCKKKRQKVSLLQGFIILCWFFFYLYHKEKWYPFFDFFFFFNFKY
jgi:hypothetical protein